MWLSTCACHKIIGLLRYCPFFSRLSVIGAGGLLASFAQKGLALGTARCHTSNTTHNTQHLTHNTQHLTRYNSQNKSRKVSPGSGRGDVPPPEKKGKELDNPEDNEQQQLKETNLNSCHKKLSKLTSTEQTKPRR